MARGLETDVRKLRGSSLKCWGLSCFRINNFPPVSRPEILPVFDSDQPPKKVKKKKQREEELYTPFPRDVPVPEKAFHQK